MTTSRTIAAAFERARSQGRMAFMPFITAGDPDIGTTVRVLEELVRQRVDLIEIGFPYSDPIADGPVIQASYTRALAKHLHVQDIFAAIRTLRESAGDELPPLVGMVSYAIIFRIGPDAFAAQAAAAGFSGLIVPDLPGDEASEFLEIAGRHGLDIVPLVAPTTPPERARVILSHARGFVYCIAVAGTTGERNELPATLQDHLKMLRQATELPLAVGFGIGRPEHVSMLRGLADGVIVGSAIVRQFEAFGENANADEVIARLGRYAADMLAATHPSRA